MTEHNAQDLLRSGLFHATPLYMDDPAIVFSASQVAYIRWPTQVEAEKHIGCVVSCNGYDTPVFEDYFMVIARWSSARRYGEA